MGTQMPTAVLQGLLEILTQLVSELGAQNVE